MSCSFLVRDCTVAAVVVLCAVSSAFGASLQYQQIVLGDGPVLYYRFNELSGNVTNYGSLGTAFDGVRLGTPVLDVATSSGDSGLGFNSSDDYVQSLGTAPAGLTGNPTFSAEAVVFVPLGGTVGLWAPILHWGDSEGVPNSKSVYFAFSHFEPDEIYAGFYNGGLQAPGCHLPRGHWHHVVWVRQGGGTDLVGSTVYIDGANITTALVPDPNLCCNGSTPVVTTTEFRVNRARDFDGQRYFIGTLDELALYDRALAPEEVAEHYESLAFIFAGSFESGQLCAWGVAGEAVPGAQ